MKKEEHQAIIDKIRETLGAENSALISDDLANLTSDYTATLQKIDEKSTEINSLKEKNAELIDVNGKLFQKVGMEQTTENKDVPENNKEDSIELDIDDLIDEKGDLI